MNPEFKEKLISMRPTNMRRIACAAADDAAALSALAMAHDFGFATATLFGPAAAIQKIAAEHNINLAGFDIVDCGDPLAAAAGAVRCVRDGDAHILMKGHIQTADILRAVLNRETGIRGDGILSHVASMYSPTLRRTVLMTDAAMVMYPDLPTKVALIKNAVTVAHKMGIENPIVAPLAAVETVNPAMAATVDAAELTQMNARGEITGCRVFGPLAFDGAISVDAARTKGITNECAGRADILLFHNIEAANSTMKSMVHFGGFVLGGVVMGARVPIVINSRSDSDMSKLYSIAIATQI